MSPYRCFQSENYYWLCQAEARRDRGGRDTRSTPRLQVSPAMDRPQGCALARTGGLSLGPCAGQFRSGALRTRCRSRRSVASPSISVRTGHRPGRAGLPLAPRPHGEVRPPRGSFLTFSGRLRNSKCGAKMPEKKPPRIARKNPEAHAGMSKTRCPSLKK